MASPLARLMRNAAHPLNQYNVFVGVTRTDGPTAEPVTTEEAKLHVKVESGVTEDNALIASLIIAARTYVENFTGRSLITQTWQLVLDTFPSAGEILLPKGPLQSVTNVTTYDEADDSTAFSTSGYRVDTYGERVTLVDGYSWPTDLRSHNAVIITYVTGDGDDIEDVPYDIKQAMLMLIAHWYMNREAVIVGTISGASKLAVDSILSSYKERRL